MDIHIKRAYDQAKDEDGYRVLVDRLWPRGIAKADLQMDEWCKDVAPSAELRKWFSHDPAKFDEFRAKYMDELATTDAPEQLLKRAGTAKNLTLIYAAKDPRINHAIVLQKHLQSIS
jgi:uncharacterized protein YeaO (DUF488 family)